MISRESLIGFNFIPFWFVDGYSVALFISVDMRLSLAGLSSFVLRFNNIFYLALCNKFSLFERSILIVQNTTIDVLS